MFLDTVNAETIIADRSTAQTANSSTPYEVWNHFPHSQIAHHGKACCEIAREWFLSMDYTLLAGESLLTGPRWIRARYEWGPSAHPIYWCEAVKRKTLDCGALAALAAECFRERGVPVFPAQLVQRYPKDATAHWGARWDCEEVSTHWIHDDVIYHEGCAVLLPDDNIQLWDASAAWWINPAHTIGYGSLAALKIRTAADATRTGFQWGPHQFLANKWITL